MELVGGCHWTTEPVMLPEVGPILDLAICYLIGTGLNNHNPLDSKIVRKLLIMVFTHTSSGSVAKTETENARTIEASDKWQHVFYYYR